MLISSTGDDFLGANHIVLLAFISLNDVDVLEAIDGRSVIENNLNCRDKTDDPSDCADPDVFHLLMRATIEKCKDIHFYQFGEPVRGSNDRSFYMV